MALIYERDGQVYMNKTCPDHGKFDIYLWPNADRYRWFSGLASHTSSRRSQTDTLLGCPFDCGLCPGHKRGIFLSEIEVTWRCNLTCPVCYLAPDRMYSDPSLPTITEMLKTIRSFDVQSTSLQITGGEPTLRQDLPEIIALTRQNGFTAIELNTNGIIIANNLSFLKDLVAAGLTNIYLQFDAAEPQATQRLRGADLLHSKLAAISHCRQAGLPVILSATIVEGINDNQLGRIIDFAMQNLDVIAGLSLQPAFWSGRFDVEKRRHLSLGDVANKIAQQSDGRIAATDFWPVGCAHPLCDCSTYLIPDKEKGYRSFTIDLTEKDFRKYFDPASPQGSAITEIITGIYNNASVPTGLPVLIMGLMDAWTLDLKRLQECNLGVATADGRTIPFCAYHLTDITGRRLYPLSKEELPSLGHS